MATLPMATLSVPATYKPVTFHGREGKRGNNQAKWPY